MMHHKLFLIFHVCSVTEMVSGCRSLVDLSYMLVISHLDHVLFLLILLLIMDIILHIQFLFDYLRLVILFTLSVVADFNSRLFVQ